jgi:3-phenylpropionate/trans-cinnamate dioxygenase ferredoxin subunit
VPILVLRAGSSLVAVEGRCPHAGSALEGGSVQGGVLECPLHGWRFDLRTGGLAKHWWNPPTAIGSRAKLRRLPVRVEADTVYVQLGGCGTTTPTACEAQSASCSEI